MIVKYFNRQDKSDPLNGRSISGRVQLVKLLDSVRGSPPFVAELCGENGFVLTIGIGGDVGSVQHSRMDGALPYLMALPKHGRISKTDVEFRLGNTPTPIPARYILSFDEVRHIALHFLETGERSADFAWESI